MLISCGYTLAFEAKQPTPLAMLLTIRPERMQDLHTEHRIVLEPSVPAFDFIDDNGNVCSRLTVPPGRLEVSCDFVIEDSGKPDGIAIDAIQHSIDQLPDEVLPFLLPSRYCESDLLSDTAWCLFAGTQPSWQRVQAIVDFTHERIAFGYKNADRNRSAVGAYEQRVGVCRDYAHLAIALCRAMNIPARYCTGYLGDIGVPAVDLPMDFSAWIEVWLGDRWHTFDPRHNERRIGRVLVAVGRDATETALTTAFGSARLTQFQVRCEEFSAAREFNGATAMAA